MLWFVPPLPIGTPAPDFSVPDQDGSRVTLSALRGKNVVLVFYPADDTSVCTKQLCEFRDQWALAKARNAVVLGVNHARRGSHQRFRDKHKFPFPLLIDKDQKIRRGKPSPQEVLASAV
jgi:thioredoxin-dependent peroxiredoxin